MTPLQIDFELADTPQRFAHIRSVDGVLGHADEVRCRIPKGTWLTLQPSLHRLTPWLIRKCGFAYRGAMVGATGVEEVLQKVED